MKLTEKERDLLVNTLIESLWQFPLEGTHRSVREMIVHKAIMPTVEGVLADRAVPDEVMLGNAYNTGYRAALATVQDAVAKVKEANDDPR